jgi:hypothetical protein
MKKNPEKYQEIKNKDKLRKQKERGKNRIILMTTTAGHSFYIGSIVFFYYRVNDTGS